MTELIIGAKLLPGHNLGDRWSWSKAHMPMNDEQKRKVKLKYEVDKRSRAFQAALPAFYRSGKAAAR